MNFFSQTVEMVLGFIDMGGPVLLLIGSLLFVMWSLIFERMFFFSSALKEEIRAVVTYWENRDDKRSWRARKIREALISETTMKINQNMGLIKTLVALAPMLGLLGTVTGMISVFNIMAVSGGGDPKSMAGGVSRATVPTMAGMVAALSGVFAQAYLNRIVERESALIEDRLTSGDDPNPPTVKPRTPPTAGGPATGGPAHGSAPEGPAGAAATASAAATSASAAQPAGERFVDRFPPGSVSKAQNNFDDDGLL